MTPFGAQAPDVARACSFLASWFRFFVLIVPALAACHAGRDGLSEAGAVYSGGPSGRQDRQAFVIAGDTQRTGFWEFWRERNDGARREVLKKIASEDPAFVIHLGDLVFRGASRRHWQLFDEEATLIRNRGIPVFPLLGNHDYYGSNGQALENFFSRFPHLNRQKWTAFTFRSVGIILLDSNFQELSAEEIKAQEEWYLRTLAEFQSDPGITIILAACHHAPYTNSTVVSDDMQAQKAFVGPFMTTPKAKLFFSGHSHSYEHFVIQGRHFIVSGGGGGPRHRLLQGPKARHEDACRGGPLRGFGFCRVALEDDGMRIQAACLDAEAATCGVCEEFRVR